MPKKYEKKGDYDIGFAKPPKSTRWQKGQSGNPSGKKKGKSLAQYLLEAGEEEKIFLQDGKQVAMPVNEALAKQIYADAIKGMHQAAKIVVDAQKTVASDMPSGTLALTGPEEIEVARAHAEWLKLIEDVQTEEHDDDANE